MCWWQVCGGKGGQEGWDGGRRDPISVKVGVEARVRCGQIVRLGW
jgi:hypothetical protein